MGGMTATVAASYNPPRLRRLVLVDPTFLTPQHQREVYESDVAVQHQTVLSEPQEGFLTEMLIKRCHRPRELIEIMVQARYQTSVNAFEILTLPNPDYRQLISTLTIPTMLVIGGVGSIITPIEAEALSMINLRLKVVQIAEAGHGIPFDQPDRLASVIIDFLSLESD